MAQKDIRQIDPFKNIVYGNLNLEQKYEFKGNMEFPFNIEAIGITYPDKDYFIARERADYYVIEFVAEGKGQLSINGKEYALEQGDVYLLPPERSHRYRADSEQPYRKFWCNFYSNTFAKIQTDYRLDGIYVFHAPECEEDFLKLVELAALGNRINDDEWTKIASILMNILNKLALKSYRSERNSTIASRAKVLLDNSIFDNITVDELTKQLFVSKTILTREFKKIYGMSPYHYYLNKKLSQAKLMLHNSNLSVKEISDTLCFSDEHYFSGLFKRKVGVSPSDFRKQLNV